VDAAGVPTGVQASDKLPDSLRDRIEAVVGDWRFVPAAVDGVAAPATTYVALGVCAMPDASEGLNVAIDYKGNGPRPLERDVLLPPPYPIEAARAGMSVQLVAQYLVQSDGSVVLENVEYADDAKASTKRAFTPAIRDWVKQMRYEPERVAGQPVATRIRTPVQFELSRPGTTLKAMQKHLEERQRDLAECAAAAAGDDKSRSIAVDSPVKLLKSG